MSKFRLEIRRFLTIRGTMLWNSLPIGVVGSRNLPGFEVELDKFMKEII